MLAVMRAKTEITRTDGSIMDIEQNETSLVLRWKDSGSEAQRFLLMGGFLCLFGLFAFLVGPQRLGGAAVYIGTGTVLIGSVFVLVGLFSNPVSAATSRFDLTARRLTIERLRARGDTESLTFSFDEISALYCVKIRSKGSSTNTACLRLGDGRQVTLGRTTGDEKPLERDLAVIRSGTGLGREDQSTAGRLVSGFFGVSKR